MAGQFSCDLPTNDFEIEVNWMRLKLVQIALDQGVAWTLARTNEFLYSTVRVGYKDLG